MRKSGLKERLVWQLGDRWLETVVDPMREEGRITGYVHFIFDVTERKKTEARLKDAADQLRQMMDGSIRAIASTLEMRDPYTAGHQRRVADLACAMATEMKMPEDQIEGLRIACYVHDIGKIAVPAEILAKPSKLSEHEFGIIKTHSQFGADVLKEIDFIWPVAEATLQHHERLDGSGYPNHLKAGKIIPEARILAVADVVEAMCSHRPYRPALGIPKALQEIADGRGTRYDTKAVDVCTKLFRKKHFQFKS
jgi:HD-GYP domain-containing protein (c-di-GMP phosphodiesterase class II)